MTELPNYNMDSIENAVGTVIMATSITLYREGYKPDQVLEIMKRITDVYMAVFEKRATVTTEGIIFKPFNVTPINDT